MHCMRLWSRATPALDCEQRLVLALGQPPSGSYVVGYSVAMVMVWPLFQAT